MNTLATLICTAALSFAAFVTLAAGMDRHREDVLIPHAKGLLQWFSTRCTGTALAWGWGLLALALLPCLWRWPAALAVLVWLGLLSVSATALGLVLSYAPSRASRSMDAALVLAALAAALVVLTP